MTAVAFPKPEPRPKKARKPLQRKVRLQVKSWGVSRGPSKTKHARRPREWGFMAFCHWRGCELALDLDSQAILDVVHLCDGRLEFAHLSDRKRYDVGDVGACLCKRAHVGFDGRIGGKDPAYVALSREGQRTIRMRLANRARRAYEALSDAERARFKETAAARRTK